jgi:hypothetical protein
VNHVRQVEKTITAVGALREQHLQPDTRDALLAAFRNWNRRGDPAQRSV